MTKTPTTRADNLFGSEVSDLLAALAGNDTITALGGDDTIDAGTDNDLVYGGIGNDSVFGADGNDTAYGGAGNDILYGGALSYSALDGADLLYGDEGDDQIRGSDKDGLYGGVGNDSLIGYGLDGTGVAVAYGGDGNDLVSISLRGSSTVTGDAGQDTLEAYGQTSGTIVVDISGAVQVAQWSGGGANSINGFEALRFEGRDGNDSITGGGLGDVINVGAGVNVVNAGGGNDTVSYYSYDRNVLDGGAGDDQLFLSAPLAAVVLTADAVTGVMTDNHGSQISGFERIQIVCQAANDDIHLGSGNATVYGKAGNDTIAGGSGADLFLGDIGSDSLTGGVLADQLYGGTETDHLDGGAGKDYLDGGKDNDTLTGGAGNDTFVFRNAGAGIDTVTDFHSGEDIIRYSPKLLAGGTTLKGVLAADAFHLDAAVGTGQQFVLKYDALSAQSLLYWDKQGTAGAEQLLLRLDGHVSMVASDILLS